MQKMLLLMRRAAELLHLASEMGRPLVCFCGDVQDADDICKPIAAKSNVHVFHTPALMQHWLSPLVQYLPASMLISYLGEAWQEKRFQGGHRQMVGLPKLCNSRLQRANNCRLGQFFATSNIKNGEVQWIL